MADVASTGSNARRYDVALSFAGEDRQYVDRVAAALVRAGISVFYDRYEEATLWGKNLYDHLQSVYSEASAYTVLFVSAAYAGKLWTNHERQSAQSRAFAERREYILPARFDDTQVPGLLPTTGYVDLTRKTPEEFADLIIQILSQTEILYEGSLCSEPRFRSLRVTVRSALRLWKPFCKKTLRLRAWRSSCSYSFGNPMAPLGSGWGNSRSYSLTNSTSAMRLFCIAFRQGPSMTGSGNCSEWECRMWSGQMGFVGLMKD
jgi:hypothetical protein